ncbi:MAG TPA: fuconate dehydratase, partial [Amnibacterium sp.]
DHLHEHFADPCVVVDGRYLLPTAPGYSARMHDASVARFTFPDGEYWATATLPA